MLTSWLATEKPYQDPDYQTNPEGIHIHHNTVGDGGKKPGGRGGSNIAKMAGTPIPDLVWDGIVDATKLVDGKLPADKRIYAHDNKKESGEFTAVNLGGLDALLKLDASRITLGTDQFSGSLPRLKPVTLGK